MSKDTERFPSRHELDLEARLKADNEAESRVTTTTTVNPNPFGKEAYAGTDPIYQNHANKTEAPIASKEGAFKAAEEDVKDRFDLTGVDEDRVVDDYGMGGKAVKAASPVVVPSDVVVGDSSNVHHRSDEGSDSADKGDEDEASASQPTPPDPPSGTNN